MTANHLDYVFLHEVIRLKAYPRKIPSHQDKLLESQAWKELVHRCKIGMHQTALEAMVWESADLACHKRRRSVPKWPGSTVQPIDSPTLANTRHLCQQFFALNGAFCGWPGRTFANNEWEVDHQYPTVTVDDCPMSGS